MLDTRQITAMVERWQAIPLGQPMSNDKRTEILAALRDHRNPHRTVYNHVRFYGYLTDVVHQNVFMRIMQSEAERYDSGA